MMDTDAPTKHSSHSSDSTTGPWGPSGPSGSQRKERGAIAAQACDTCRSRKQKCDEQRPKCGTCQKFKLECHYREPQPTKKDKTLIEILDRIKSLEGKLDGLALQGPPAFPTSTFSTSNSNSLVAEPLSLLASESVVAPSAAAISRAESISVPGLSSPYRYVAGVHQMLAWPVMQQLLETLALPNLSVLNIEHEGVSRILGLHDAENRLPAAPAGPIVLTEYTPAAQLTSTSAGGLPPTTVALTWDAMQKLTKAYFDTFNYLYPILDRQLFSAGIMASVFNDGFSDGISSTLAFLVFALGEAALAGSLGLPIDIYNNRPSGVKGGTVTQPPGLALFNEARKRMGFSLTECSLESVQVFALAGMYCGTCAHHMEFWRMSTTASLACQALITSKPAELTSPRADLIRRAFWYCSIIETYFNLELGLPLTGLEKLDDVVGLPDFSSSYSQDGYVGNAMSHFQEHFASQIVLRRLSMEFHTALTNAQLSLGSMAPPFSPLGGTGDSSSSNLPATVKQLALQLDQWRGMLPAHLRWREEQPAQFPNPASAVFDPQQSSLFRSPVSSAVLQLPSTSASASSAGPVRLMFSSDLDQVPVAYPWAQDIQVALLRTRYYFTKYLLYRPFLYKALHHPDQMTREDAQGASECLRACLKWPVAMSPTCTHKRLVPCLFFWTQNLLGILVLLHLSQQVPILVRIRATLCGDRFEMEASETVGLYMDWVRDLKSIDRAAAWAWEVVKGIYQLRD